jgi:hypothetical protein
MMAVLKKLQSMPTSKSKQSIDRRTLLRVALTLITLFAIACAIFLTRASDAAREQTREATMARGWQNARPAVAANTAKPTIDAVISQWSMRRDNVSGQTSLAWSVADSRDIQASLLALDATQIRAQRIEIKKRESGFALTAELSQ